MKKSIYALLGILTLVFAASCAKEIAPAENEAPETPGTPAVVDNSEIPTYLVGQITDTPTVTKTSYTSAGVFSWSNTDKVDLLLYKAGASYKYLKAQKYDAVTIENDGKTATFKISNEDPSTLESGDDSPLDTWTSSHVAVYPQGMMNDHIVSECEYNTPFIKLPQQVSGASSGIILLGNPDGGTFKFKTAMAVLKVTVTSIPAEATALRLITNNKASYPIDGDFAIADNASEVKRSNYLDLFSSAHDYVYVDLSGEGAIASRDFYFNIPASNTAEDAYPAGTLSIALIGANDAPILEKTIKKDIVFQRNDLLDTPSLANEWVTLGTGRFIDNFLWSKITSDGYNATVGRDVPDYVNVTIQQKASDPYTFRLVNPYGNAASQFGYTSVNAANRDEYFVFTVDGFTQGSAVTSFQTHRTGFAIDYGHINPELVYATTYNPEWVASNDKVVLGGETYPKIVQLAPVYRYNGSSTAYGYSSHLMNRKSVFRIIFPGVSGYTCSLTPASGCTSRLDKLSWANGSNSARMRIIASEYTDYEIASPNVNGYYIGNYPGAKDAAGSYGTWSGASLTNTTVNGSSIPSGIVYLTWYAVDSSDENFVYDQGRTTVYYINKTDYDNYVKSHIFHYGETTAAGAWKYGTIEFGLSNDPTKGQLILKEVDGMTSVAANTRLTADHPLWTAMGTWLAHGTGDYAYSSDRVTDGNTYYGIINNSRLSFATSSSFEFFNYSVDGVEGHTAKIIIFSNDGSTSDSPEELAFDITADKLTLAHDYLVARWIGYFWNGSTVTNSGGKASKPLAQKDGDVRPYISLE